MNILLERARISKKEFYCWNRRLRPLTYWLIHYHQTKKLVWWERLLPLKRRKVPEKEKKSEVKNMLWILAIILHQNHGNQIWNSWLKLRLLMISFKKLLDDIYLFLSQFFTTIQSELFYIVRFILLVMCSR